jgi:tetratricopeptide (TPR) repeat protein
VREALATRHFGRFVAAYRHAFDPPITQARVGLWLKLSQAQVSRMEVAKTAPSDLNKLQRWAAALAVPRDLLWFAPTHASEESGSGREVANLEDVRRRSFLKGTGAVIAVGSGLVDSPWQRVAETLAGRRPADPTTVTLMENKTAAFFRSEETQPARELMISLRAHRGEIIQLIRDTGDEHLRQRLLTSAGETAALEGWTLFDLNRPQAAIRLYEKSLENARAAGDRALEACVLGYWSYLLSSRDDNAEAVRMLTEASGLVRGAAAATQAWVSARRAEEQAALGDATSALRSLDSAVTVFDYANPMTERPWTSFFTASRLGGLAVSTYGRMNHPETDEAARVLLNSLMPTENKVKALVLADLATSAGRVADFDRVEMLANQAAPLAVRTEASLAIDRLWEVVELLPDDPRNAAGRTRKQLTEQLLASPTA